MKKIISKIILVTFSLISMSIISWRLIIQPCIEFYHIKGWLGVVSWLIALAIICFVIYLIVKIIGWAIENS